MLLLLSLLLVSVLASPGGCDFGDTLPPASFTTLIQNVKAKKYANDMVAYLTNWAKNNTLGFTGNQTLGLLAEFVHSTDKLRVANAVSKFILTLECKDLVRLIKASSHSSDQIELLKMFVNYSNFVDLKVNNASVIASFVHSSDKQAAKKIIDGAKPRSCLFGGAEIPLFTFIIDVSGSMSDTFRDQDGIWSRLSYVQRDLLNVLNGTLNPSQEFNIIKFSSSPSAWKPGIVPATYENIVSASNFVRNLSPGGMTAYVPAIKLGFQDPRTMAAYLLSDGAPSDSLPEDKLLQFAASFNKPIHCIAFKADLRGQQFLRKLAVATRGTFRNIVP